MRKDAAARPRIAVIEDDAEFRAIVAGWLRPRYEVAAYAVAEELLAGAAPAPDLVISDVKLPGLNGFRCCEELRKDPRFAGVPVLFLTGVDSDEGFLLGLEAGADAYLTKPVERLSLLEKIGELLERSRAGAR